MNMRKASVFAIMPLRAEMPTPMSISVQISSGIGTDRKQVNMTEKISLIPSMPIFLLAETSTGVL